MVRDCCPICEGRRWDVIAAVEARRICELNSTYRSNALEILGLGGRERFEIARCRSCGFVFSSVVPAEEFLRTLYEEVIDPDRAYLESLPAPRLAHQLHFAAGLLNRLSARADIRILDYGCGYGAIVLGLQGPNVQCVGFEPFQPPAESARKRGVTVVSSTDELGGFGPFDGVLLSDVLEHTGNPRETLQLVRSFLAADGWIGVSVPDFGGARLKRILEDVRSGREFTRELNPWEHLNYFSPKTLSLLLASEGFCVEASPSRQFGLRSGLRGVSRLGNTVKSLARFLGYAAQPRLKVTIAYASLVSAS